MAELKQNPISFPWELFQQAQEAKNRNQRLLYKDIEGMGQGAGQIGLDIQQYKARQALMQALQQMRNPGVQQGPQLPGVGMTAGQPAPTSGMGAPAPSPDFGSMAVNFATAFPGQQNPLLGAFASQFDPEKQAIIQHLKAETSALPSKTASDIQHQRAEEALKEILTLSAQEESKRAAQERSLNEKYRTQAGIDAKRAQLTASQFPFHGLLPWETPTEKAIKGLHGPLDEGMIGPAEGFNKKSKGWSIKKH